MRLDCTRIPYECSSYLASIRVAGRVTCRVLRCNLSRAELVFASARYPWRHECSVGPGTMTVNNMTSDMQLHWNVRNALNRPPSADGTGISVTVKEGVVTLTGRVDSYLERWEVERTAARVIGVRKVVAEVRVNLAGANGRSDADIACAAAKALNLSTYLPKNSLQVMVERGHVTLSGEVEWEYQRDAATTVVRWLAGVTDVTNNTIVKQLDAPIAVRPPMEEVRRRPVVDNPTAAMSGTVR